MLLTPVEFERLVELLGLLNNTEVTQLDTAEEQELHGLLHKITNDGEERRHLRIVPADTDGPNSYWLDD